MPIFFGLHNAGLNEFSKHWKQSKQQNRLQGEYIKTIHHDILYNNNKKKNYCVDDCIYTSVPVQQLIRSYFFPGQTNLNEFLLAAVAAKKMVYMFV